MSKGVHTKKQFAIAEFLEVEGNESLSNRAVGKILGVDHKTVGAVRRLITGSSEAQKPSLPPPPPAEETLVPRPSFGRGDCIKPPPRLSWCSRPRILEWYNAEIARQRARGEPFDALGLGRFVDDLIKKVEAENG